MPKNMYGCQGGRAFKTITGHLNSLKLSPIKSFVKSCYLMQGFLFIYFLVHIPEFEEILYLGYCFN